MKHLWIVDMIEVTCSRCGMRKSEWEIIGKPFCKEKLPIPDEPEENYNYI